jgi:hypothetical protein
LKVSVRILTAARFGGESSFTRPCPLSCHAAVSVAAGLYISVRRRLKKQTTVSVFVELR